MTGLWRSCYEAALPRARIAAGKLPLVRVVVPRTDPRQLVEVLAVFQAGRLGRDHKSPKAREKEEQLGVADSLYFHAGRPHPDYGRAVIVLRQSRGPEEATPFGIGQLECDSGTLCSKGACLKPVAHKSRLEQQTFVSGSTWRGEWRKCAGHYLAAYFGDDLLGYFRSGPTARPKYPDPEAIYSNPANIDWRSWTVEVRVLNDINLIEAIAVGDVLLWGLEEDLENWIQQRILDEGRSLSEVFPVLAALPPVGRVVSGPPEIGKTLCEIVQNRVVEDIQSAMV